MPPREFKRLAQALSLIFGVEVLIVLKDIWGLDSRRTRSVAQWAAGALVRAAVAESMAKRGGIGQRRRRNSANLVRPDLHADYRY